MHMTNCPSEETLAAFIDGRLDPEARQRVVEHVATCEDCYAIVSTAWDFQAAEPATEAPGGSGSGVGSEGRGAVGGRVVRGRFGSRAVWGAVAAAAVAAVVVVGLYSPLHEKLFPPKTGLSQLVEASQPLEFRPSKARLSGDFPYRESRRAMRGGGDKNEGDTRDTTRDLSYAKVWLLASRLQEEVRSNPTPDNLHQLGISNYMLERFDEAAINLVESLKSETRQNDLMKAIAQSTNASLLNDLAATYASLIERKNMLSARPLAMEAIQRAWALQRTPQIAWTRAIIIESLHVRERSIRAWRDYLALDPEPEWRNEAMQKLARLTQPADADLWQKKRNELLTKLDDTSGENILPIVDRFRQDVRLLCEDELLPQWGEAFLQGASSSSNQLARIEILGKALARTNHEHDVADAVAAIHAADPASLKNIAAGHAAYGAGRRAMTSLSAREAARQLDTAIAFFGTRTPFVWRARAEHAGAIYLVNDYAHALQELTNLVQLHPDGSPALIGRIHSLFGITYLQSASPERAIEHYEQAIEVYRNADEKDYEAALHVRLAEAYQYLGKDDEFDEHNDEALRLLEETGHAQRWHEVIFNSAYNAIEKEQPALADLFLDVVVEGDLASHDKARACTSLMWRGAYHFRRGMTELAATDVNDANEICRSISDADVRERALANLGLAHATLSRDAPGQTDLNDLDAAVAYFDRTRSEEWLRTAHFIRARILSARGDVADAEADFRASLEEASATRERINQRENRISFTATAAEMTDGYVEFLLQQHRDRDAFEASDRARMRELVDAPGCQWAAIRQPSVIGAIQAALPPAAAMIEYRVLNEHITAWVIGPRTFDAMTLPLPISQVKSILERVDTHMPEARFREPMASLYDALIVPLDAFLKSAEMLIIVPDDELERVPYAGLYDRTSGRYFVEMRTTVVVPSGALFIQSAARLSQRTTGSDRICVINAASSGRHMNALPEVDEEVQSVAKMFANARVIADAKSAHEVLESAADATLLHYAGHGVEEMQHSLRMLRLGEESDQRVGPADIYDASLPHVRIAYLSACETDTGPNFKSEGSVTIARSFFAAGVPVVVATLWSVEDTTAYDIARVFYADIRAGATPAQALRNAQSKLLSQPTTSRADWAAFRVIGAGIPLQKRFT
jgi:CHAT domain-containing protein